MALAETGETDLPKGYVPSENEAFMNSRQLAYFRRKLLSWKAEIIETSRQTIAALRLDTESRADIADRASTEADRTLELRTRDRQRKLVAKIDAALGRIENGTYGYCEDTGEPIRIARLNARPIATLSLEAQERHEHKERTRK